MRSSNDDVTAHDATRLVSVVTRVMLAISKGPLPRNIPQLSINLPAIKQYTFFSFKCLVQNLKIAKRWLNNFDKSSKLLIPYYLRFDGKGKESESHCIS